MKKNIKSIAKFLLAGMVIAASVFTSCNTSVEPTDPEDKKPIIFTLTFDSNNGTGLKTTQQIQRSKTVNLDPCTFTWAGHGFTGWSTTMDGTGEDAKFYKDQDTIKINRNTTLYAQWVEYDSTVTFMLNKPEEIADSLVSGGTMELMNFSSKVDTALPRCQYMIKGKGFLGWTSKIEADVAAGDDPSTFTVTVEYDDEATITAGTYEPGTNLVLYAVWADPDYFVTYHSNAPEGCSVSGTMETQGFITGKEQKLYANEYTCKDYILKGWSKTAAAPESEVDYAPEAKIVLASDLDLYAVWTKKITKLVFDRNGTGITGAMETIEFYYDAGVVLPECQYSNPNGKFKGWSLLAEEGIVLEPGYEYKPSEYRETVTIYAQWTPYYTVTYAANEESATGSVEPVKVLEGTEITVAANGFTVNKKSFDGWADAATGSEKTYKPGDKITVTKDMTLYAQWLPIFTITYKANGMEAEDITQTCVYGETIWTLRDTAFEKQHEFVKYWNTKADGTGNQYWTYTAFSPNSDMTLYAQWKPKTYSILHTANLTGEPVENNPGVISCTYGSTATVSSKVPTTEHYTFKEWNEKEDGTGKTYKAGEKIALDSTIRIYAIWTPKQYTVTLNGRGQSKLSGKAITITYNYGETVTLPKPAEAFSSSFVINKISGGTSSRYTSGTLTQKGWSTSESSYTVYYSLGDNINQCKLGDVTLYAVWEYPNYYVRFNANHGESVEEDSYTNDSYVVPISSSGYAIKRIGAYTDSEFQSGARSKYGSVFVGWSDKPNGTVSYFPGSSTVMQAAFSKYKVNELYAVWVHFRGIESSQAEGIYVNDLETTFGDWYKVTGKTVCGVRSGTYPEIGDDNWENYPICNIKIADMIDFCNTLSVGSGLTKVYTATSSSTWTVNKTASGFRIPYLEEHLAISNVYKTFDYPGSNTPDDCCWYSKNSGDKLHPVGQWGIGPVYGYRDLSGNAAEITMANNSNNSHNFTYTVYLAGGDYKSTAAKVKATAYEEKSFNSSTVLEAGFRLVRNK